MDVPGWSGRDLEVISDLRRLGDAANPDAETRERIRNGLLERLAGGDRPGGRRRVLAEVLAAAVALAIALAGLGLVLSKDALPGDALYGIKRAGESAELGLTFGDSAKAQRLLEFASNRLDELTALGDASPAVYLSTLADFQREAKAGTAELTKVATQGSGRQLGELRTWSLDQHEKLLAAQGGVPSGAFGEFVGSAELLSRIEARAQTLQARLDCFQITTGQTDELGAVPQAGSCEPPVDTFTGAQPPAPVPIPPSSGQLPAQDVSTSTVPVTPAPPTPLPAPAPSQAPTAVEAPVPAPTSPRAPTTTSSSPPPLISIPPVLPGLPGVGIG
ncbi:DUF5667 domain-containing protein [Amycolatopsis alkalitolerans]|uniref:DUF5667 domain-containing protein n=1 Tax=Amycolatopsis alkalitolerans TaxID=2547244 RepID=A0A5C4M9T2_9PSEU|nr:DUF5667 domain-containing protein [Amycolatopsis alkalitolerans]TNC28558.1 hypothetical protein FG385_04610 [Amycolatopsis alkalitolerans]